MKFKLLVVILALAVLGGGGYAARQYMRNADPATKAERLAGEGKLREALVELRTASRNNPKDAELHVRIGEVQSKLADPVAAEKEFRLALQMGADRAAVMPLLGESVLVQGRYRDVLREIPPRGPDAPTLARMLQLRALAQLGLEDVPGAQATLRDAEARAPNQPETALVAARLAAANNNQALMQSKIADVLRLDPNQVEALLMDEKLKTLQGDRPAALALADRAVKAAPWSAMARIERANQFIFANDDKKAQADVDAVLQAQPRFIDAVYLNGILMARRGQLAEAALQLEKLDSVSARLPQGLYYQSLIATQQGNGQTAAEYARRYSALVPQDPDGLRLLGRAELALNRPANALPPLQKLASDLPKDAEARDLLGLAFAMLNRGTDAEAAFGNAVALAPDNALFRFHLGAQLLRAGRAGDAVANLGPAFDSDPKLPGCGAALVNALLAVGDVPKADGVIGRMRTASGDTEEVAQAAAAVKLRQGDLPGARTLLTEAARKFPAAVDLRIQLAQLLVQQSQLPEAAAQLSAILAKEPARMAALSLFIRLRAQDNDLPGAVKALEAAHRAAPKDAAITSMLADTMTANGDPKGAISLLKESGTDAALSTVAAGALGRAQQAAERPGDAQATYRRILAENPDDLLTRGSLAMLLSGEKDFAGVRATLQDALARSPNNYSLMSGMIANEVRWKGVDAGVKLAEELRQQPGTLPYSEALKGDLLLASNRPAEAAAAYAAEYKNDPSLPMLMKATTAMALANQPDPATELLSAWMKDHPTDADAAQRLAQIDIAAGRFTQAQSNLDIVLAAQPNNAVALNNLAWSYFMTGDKRALATAQKAYLQEPTALAGDTLGWVLVKTGAARAAVPLLQRASGLRPNDRGIQYHLAVALMEDGRLNEARAALQPLTEGPAFPDQDEARKLAESIKPKQADPAR